MNVLFDIVLVGPLELLAPFASLQARTAVMPVKVTFEKLFRLTRMVDPFGDESPPPLVQKVTVPPALALLKPVTIRLLLMDSVPVAVMLLVPRLMKVTEPVVFTFKFVNVLLSTFPAALLPWLQVR